MELNENKPLPHCKALLLSEKVTEHQVTGAISLHNLIESFRLAAFPGRYGPFAVFLQLYDGIDRYHITMEVNALDNDTSIAKATLADLDSLTAWLKLT